MKYQLSNLSETQLKELAVKLNQGQIAVIPTDTQYGIVTSALKPASVEKIYQLRKRSSDKPMIILISDLSDIEKFNITLTETQTEKLKSMWPNPLSIIIPVDDKKLEYLHRGKNSLAFRMPTPLWLQNLLKSSGPLVAPSANFEGEPPATNINEAIVYFGNQIDFYLDNGELNNPSSTVIKFDQEKIKIIRQGVYQVHE